MDRSDWGIVALAVIIVALLIGGWIALDNQDKINDRLERQIGRVADDQRSLDIRVDRASVLLCALAYGREADEQALMDRFSVYGRLDPSAVAADWPECVPLFERIGALSPP